MIGPLAKLKYTKFHTSSRQGEMPHIECSQTMFTVMVIEFIFHYHGKQTEIHSSPIRHIIVSCVTNEQPNVIAFLKVSDLFQLLAKGQKPRKGNIWVGGDTILLSSYKALLAATLLGSVKTTNNLTSWRMVDLSLVWFSISHTLQHILLYDSDYLTNYIIFCCIIPSVWQITVHYALYSCLLTHPGINMTIYGRCTIFYLSIYVRIQVLKEYIRVIHLLGVQIHRVFYIAVFDENKTLSVQQPLWYLKGP